MPTAYELLHEAAQQLGDRGRQFHRDELLRTVRQQHPDTKIKDSTFSIQLRVLAVNVPWKPSSHPSLRRRAFLYHLGRGYYRLAKSEEKPVTPVSAGRPPPTLAVPEEYGRIQDLNSAVLSKLGLDLHWLLAVGVLAAQEVAVILKLKQLGRYQERKQTPSRTGQPRNVYTELHDHVRALEDAMPNVSRSILNLLWGLRAARNQLIHRGQQVDEDTFRAAWEGTRMLLRNLGLDKAS